MKVIPRKWKHVSIEKYNALMKTVDQTEKDEPDYTTYTPAQVADKQLEDLELMIVRAALLTDLDYEEAELLPMRELMKVNELIATPISKSFSRFFYFKGQLYEICLNPTKENARRCMNVMNTCKENPDKNLHRVMFSICKPINNRVQRKEVKIAPEKIDETVDSFRHLPISIAQPAVVFFCNLSIELTSASLEYSNRQMRKMQKLLNQEVRSLGVTDGR